MLAALVILAAACIPVPTCGNPVIPPCATPTPTILAEQADHTNTAGFRVYWKYAEDADWRGYYALPAFQGDSESGPVWPLMSIDFPIQRVVPAFAAYMEVDVAIKAYSPTNVESAASSILRICMPPIWTGGPYQ